MNNEAKDFRRDWRKQARADMGNWKIWGFVAIMFLCFYSIVVVLLFVGADQSLAHGQHQAQLISCLILAARVTGVCLVGMCALLVLGYLLIPFWLYKGKKKAGSE